MKLEIARVLVCTTAHLTPDDNQALFDETTNLVVYEMGEYGWMIYTGDVGLEKQHSDNLENLLEFARCNDCEWIRLDRDGETIEGLPVYEW